MNHYFSVKYISLARVLMVISALSMAVYLESQGAKPCLLCVLQRYILLFIAIVSVLQHALCNQPIERWINCALMVGLCCIGAALVYRHLWLIYYVEKAGSCLPDFDYLIQHINIGQLLHLVFTESTSCAEDRSQFLGVLLPYWLLAFYGFNLIIEVLMQRCFTLKNVEKGRHT